MSFSSPVHPTQDFLLSEKMSTLTVFVREARDLPNMDKGKGNLTDAYVQVEYGGQKQKTRTIKDDLNPRWEQTLTFPLGSDPDITLKVYDDDPLIDDYIGQTIVPLSRVPFEDWLQLTNKKSLPVGYLLVRVDDGSGGRSGGAGVAGAAAGAGAVAGAGAGAAAGSRYGQDRAYDRYDRSKRVSFELKFGV